MIQKSERSESQLTGSQSRRERSAVELTVDGDEIEMRRLGDEARLQRSNVRPYVEND